MRRRMLGRTSGDVERPFIFSVTVGNSDSFTIPTQSTGVYNALVDWGDGNSTTLTTWNVDNTHTYTTAGTYDITISGEFRGWMTTGVGLTNSNKITELKQWGILRFFTGPGNSMRQSFMDARNMEITATDTPTFDVDGASQFMMRCYSVTSIPNVDQWDISSLEGLSYFFRDVPVNPDVTNWDTSNIESIGLVNLNGGMFYGSNFNRNVGGWDIGNLGNATGAFLNCNLSTENWDAILIGWQGQPHQNNVRVDSVANYTSGGAAEAARTALIADGWTINDAGPV